MKPIRLLDYTQPGLAGKLFIIGLLPLIMACYGMKRSKGGGQNVSTTVRKVDAADVMLHPGYKIEPKALLIRPPVLLMIRENFT